MNKRQNELLEDLLINKNNQIKELKDIIDKAIQLIENKTVIVPDEEGGGLILFDSDIRDLLETLKGE